MHQPSLDHPTQQKICPGYWQTSVPHAEIILVWTPEPCVSGGCVTIKQLHLTLGEHNLGPYSLTAVPTTNNNLR